jgi:adenylate cyclase
VRVRLSDTQAWLNLKSMALGTERMEFEYPIPLADGREILAQLCGRVIDKTRHHVPWGELLIEIDEFHGDNAGLIVAEIELPSSDHVFARPEWLGEDVSDDLRYFNNQLALKPFSQWATA